jgi:formate C-acetyltransferase
MNTVSGILAELGEPFAGGFMELLGETPVRRWSRAVQRSLENASVPPYAGTYLYPGGPVRVGGEDAILARNYSFTWSFNRGELTRRLESSTPEETSALEALLGEMNDVEGKLAQGHSAHRVGGHGYTHSIPNYGRVIREGLDSYEARVRNGLAGLRDDESERRDFLLGMLDVLAGVRAWHGRLLAELQRVQFAPSEAEDRRMRLLQALRQVPFRPARTFYEGMVAYNLVFYLDRCDNPGRVDYELEPFYRRDAAEGVTGFAEAEAMLREFWRNVDVNSGWSTTIGGCDGQGRAAYGDLTLACLRAARGMRRPNLQLRIRQDMPDDVWEEALNTVSTGTGLPALHNEEEFLRSLREADLGIAEEDLAYMNGGGCTETMIHGRSNVGSLDAGINLPLVLVNTLQRVLPKAGSFADVWRAYQADLRQTVAGIVQHVNEDQKAKASWRPQPVRSLLIDDCIDRGVEFNAGGARYNWSVINIAGLGNVVDSLAAVREVVFERREISGAELAGILAANFAGQEALRQRLSRCPRFGNDQPAADELAHEVGEFVFREFLGHRAWRGGRFLGSCLMFVTYAQAGKGVGATPDGRLADAPLADSAGPVQGRDLHGPTACIKSLGAIPHRLAPGTLVVNTRFAKAHFQSPDGRAKLRALFRTYFDLGGMQMQVNVVDQELLRDAVAHPEEYPNLVVLASLAGVARDAAGAYRTHRLEERERWHEFACCCWLRWRRPDWRRNPRW